MFSFSHRFFSLLTFYVLPLHGALLLASAAPADTWRCNLALDEHYFVADWGDVHERHLHGL